MTKQKTVIALIAALLAVPGTGYAQDIMLKRGIDPQSDVALLVSGLAGEHQASVIAPRNFAEQLRRGTLRSLELEVAPGPLSEAFARSHRTRTQLPSLGLKTRQQSTGYMMWELKNVQVTSYSISGASDADKFGRVKIQFPSPPTQSSGRGAQVPGIEGSPVRTAGAPSERLRPGTVQLTVADLLPVSGLQLASKLIPWGQTATIPTNQASSTQGGSCEFRYTYDTANQGQAAAGPATNLVLLDAPAGAVLTQDAIPGLAVAAQHKSSGMLWLKPGTWALYVHADGKKDVAESDEQNNLRRVRVQLDGSCD
jgi:hypothetical protein